MILANIPSKLESHNHRLCLYNRTLHVTIVNTKTKPLILNIENSLITLTQQYIKFLTQLHQLYTASFTNK